MTTDPPSPTPPKRPRGWPLQGLLLLAIGGAAYYGFELIDDAVTGQIAEEQPSAGVIEVADLPTNQPPPAASTPSHGPGNGLLRRAVAGLDARPAITARLKQSGWLTGQPIETRGDYAQLGSGPNRKFLLRLEGRVAGSPTKLLRVSDKRFLWTDLVFADPSQPQDAEPQRSVTRVDLRRVRRALAESGPVDRLAADPGSWSRFGGLPTLLSGLEEAFAFGPPYRMQLRDQVVLAMVGRWRPERLAALAEGAPPARTPHHVVVALVERDLTPTLLEYRGRDDSLAVEGLPDEQVLRPSSRPLLKMDLAINTTPEATPDPRLFTYRASVEGFADETDRELRLVEASRAKQVASVTR